MENTATPAATTSGASASTASAATTVNDAAAALAFADSSFATPETPAASTPAAAGTPPVETPASASPEAQTDDPRSPFIPRARFDEVNTAKNELTEKLKQYEWAKDLSALPDAERTNLLTWHRTLASDPVAAATQLLEALQSDPRFASQLRSQAARTLAAARGQQEPAPDPEPSFMVETGDGRVAFDPDAFAKWRDWNKRQTSAELRQEFQKELQPVQRVAQTFQQREEQAAYTSTVSSAIARMKAADPVFEQHTKDIAEAITADAKLSRLALGDKDTQPDPDTAIEIAWGRVYRAKVLPQHKSQTEQQVLADLKQRAVAGTTNPATATVTTPANTIGNARAALEHANQALGVA